MKRLALFLTWPGARTKWSYRSSGQITCDLSVYNIFSKGLIFIILPFFMGCENYDLDMHNTPAFKAQEFPRKFNPKGAVPFYGLKKSYDDVDGVTLPAAQHFDEKDAPKRGEKLFEIFCTTCHGQDGTAHTPVAEKLDKKPADLTKVSVRTLTDGELFVRILTEDTSMPGLRNELTDKEAWEIVAHVRQLQGKK